MTRRTITCAACEQSRPHEAKGLCRSCYIKQYTPSKTVICARCSQETPHYAKGMCKPCFCTAYNQEHPEKHAEYERARRQRNPDRARVLDRQRNQSSRRKQWKYEYGKQYYAKNIDRLQEYNRRWMKSHREIMSHCIARYHARIAELPHTLTLDEWRGLLEKYEHKCAYCGKPSQRLHREHVIPASRGGGYTVDNIVPACGSCNSRKHTMTPDEFTEYLKRYPRPQNKK